MNKFRSFAMALIAAIAVTPLVAQADLHVTPRGHLLAQSATPGCNAFGASVVCDDAHGGGIIRMLRKDMPGSRPVCELDLTYTKVSNSKTFHWQAKVSNGAGNCRLQWTSATALSVYQL